MRKLPLSSRLILSVIFVQGIMLAALVWNSVRLINDSHSHIVEDFIEEHSQLLSYALSPGLIAHDRALLIDTLQLLKKRHLLDYVVVLDANRNIMASTGSIDATSALQRKPDKSYQQAQQDQIYDLSNDINLAGQTIGYLYAGFSMQQAEAYIAKTRNQNALIAVAALLASIIITLVIGFLITRGLRQLEQGAHALQRDEFEYRIPILKNDEFSDVTNAFNTLATHLQDTKQKLSIEHEALERETRRMTNLLDNINAVVFEANPLNLQFSYVSNEAVNLLGYDLTEWYQEDFWKNRLHPEDLNHLQKILPSQITQTGDFTKDLRIANKNGDFIWTRSIYSIETIDEQLTVRGLLIDIHEQKKNEERIIYLADHDALTGLYNRRRFQEELEHQIAITLRFDQPSTLLFIDLDQFKFINDTYGHQRGDEFLLYVSNCLTNCLRQVDTIGRLGGDEFSVILPNTDKTTAVDIARSFQDSLLKDNPLSQVLNTHVSASVGITLIPEHGKTPSELLAKSDLAMYKAKRQGHNQTHVYTDSDQELVHMQAKLHWEEKIRRALIADHFVLHFQPIYALAENRISHFEVLLRLQDEGQLVYPNAFLDTAERFGLIRDIDQWVINKAIEVQGTYRRQGNNITLAINLSGRNFGDNAFLSIVKEAVKRHDADPACLIFEVTETAAVENFSQAHAFIEALRNFGCRFALDDFGIGYSSFYYLRNLPIDMIKIDGSFVRNLHESPFDRLIVKTINDLATGLNIKAIAEFVENQAITDLLQEIGIDYGQGFHLGKPGPEIITNP